jgi:hypothetical protein
MGGGIGRVYSSIPPKMRLCADGSPDPSGQTESSTLNIERLFRSSPSCVVAHPMTHENGFQISDSRFQIRNEAKPASFATGPQRETRNGKRETLFSKQRMASFQTKSWNYRKHPLYFDALGPVLSGNWSIYEKSNWMFNVGVCFMSFVGFF